MQLLIRVLKPFGYYADHVVGEYFSIPLEHVNELVKAGLAEIVVNNMGNNLAHDEDEPEEDMFE
jgi:hypothetical protein